MAARCGALTENIALLALCDSTFEPITENAFAPGTAPRADGCRLSLQHEQQIVEAFAVLLANTDNPSSVGAICLEEQATGLLVRTAVNSGEQKERTSNFERIARALENCTTGRDEETFLEEIIAACQPRLLSRLRSRHEKSPRKAGRPAIIPKLCDGMKLLQGLRILTPRFVLVEKQVILLGKAFARLESLSCVEAHSEAGRQILKAVLLDIEQMLGSTNIEALLEMIPKDIPSWSGPASHSLARSFISLAQYQYAAHYLLQRAYKDPTFRHLRIAEVASNLFPENTYSSEPRTVVAGLFTRCTEENQKGQRHKSPTKLETRLGKSRSEIESYIRSHSLQSKRVHAEIQLLFFYEASNITAQQPRVICSNKHACLLCNLFIKAHGKFHIRSCHGRLYPKRRVPLLEEVLLSESSKLWMRKVLEELNQLLEAKIKEHLEQPHLRMTDPHESIIFIPRAYTPSMLSIVPSQKSVHEEPMPIRSLASTPDELLSKEISSSNPTGSGSTSLPELNYLDRGQAIRTRIYPGTTLRFHTHRIHLELTYEWAYVISFGTSPTISSEYQIRSKDLGILVHVEWIDVDTTQDPEQIFDLGLPWFSRQVSEGILFSGLGLVLKNKTDIIVLRVLQQ